MAAGTARAGLLSAGDLELLAGQRVARLATVEAAGAADAADAAGGPHVVPVCFAEVAGRVYVPVDAKPKRGDPRRLARLRNLRANPAAALLVDAYDEDWTRLRWVLVRARARILEEGEERAMALAALEGRYPQYAAMRLTALGLPVIALDPVSVSRWAASGPVG